MDEFRIDSHKLMYHVGRVNDWLKGSDVYPVYMEVSPDRGLQPQVHLLRPRLHGVPGPPARPRHPQDKAHRDGLPWREVDHVRRRGRALPPQVHARDNKPYKSLGHRRRRHLERRAFHREGLQGMPQVHHLDKGELQRRHSGDLRENTQDKGRGLREDPRTTSGARSGSGRPTPSPRP